MSKLVFVNRFFYPDHSATSQMLSDAVSFLAGKGYVVHVVTSRLTYEGNTGLTSSEVWEGATIHRVWTSEFGRDSLPGRALDYVTFYLSVLWALTCLLERGDTVVAKTDPPLLSVPVGIAARLKGASLVNWLQDLFPEVAIELGMRIPVLIMGLLTWARNLSLLQAQRNIAISELMRNRLLKVGVNTDRAAVVPNWADGEAIVPREGINPLTREWSLENKFVVGYSGNLGRAHEIETLLGAIRQLSSDPSVVFLFIGGGALLDELKTRLGEHGMSNCLFKPYQPREQLPLSLTLPDVHLVILKPEMEGLIVPSKIYGVMSAGKPMLYIGNTEGEVASLVLEQGIGEVVAEGDSGALVSHILNMKDNPESLAVMGHASRRLFDQHYSREKSLAKLEAALC
jgi:colanic acid biosynthesis glycosyl transferase WcaI